jgi:transposase-like protein
MRELSVAEQRYRAVLAVISDGRTVTETAAAVGVSRQSLHVWLARYEAGGLEGLVDGSHRPVSHPRQMSAAVDVVVLDAATTRRDALSAPRPSVETPELDRPIDAARNELGASVFDTAWRHGEDLPIHDAIDQAAASLTSLLETRSR